MLSKIKNEFNNIEKINKLQFENIINSTNNKIQINFEELSEIIFNDFIKKHLYQTDIYLGLNYKINIDIIEYNFELYIFFIDCIEKSYELIKNSKPEYLELFGDINIWNFCIFQNVMFNYPFTLDNIIYIPIQYIKDNWINKDYNNLSRTIIHEKLHVGQRLNQNIWDQFILNTDNRWIKINKSDEKFIIIENNIKFNNTSLINENEEFISNPDTYYDDFKYLYSIGNELYWGNYVYNYDLKKINIKYFQLDLTKKILKKTKKKLEQEHPYETFAYSISEEII